MADNHDGLLPPPPLAGDERFRLFGELAARLSDIDLSPLLVYLVDTVDASALPYLGEQFHIMGAEGWSLTTTEEQKRALLARAIELHRHKGTPWAIKEALVAAGFNDLVIEERLPETYYDGSISYAGAEIHDYYSWAHFRVVADAGDDQPVSAEQTARIIETINAWKPASRHLVSVQHRASDSERIDVDEDEQHAGDMALADQHLWGRRFHDGALCHDQADLHHWDDTRLFDGLIRYNGLTLMPAHARYDSRREADGMAGAVVIGDRQTRLPAWDGTMSYRGYADHGASPPPAVDSPMPIIVRRHRRFDGHRHYGEHLFDGLAFHAGQFSYRGNAPYSGDIVTCLEAR